MIPEQCELEELHWLQRHGARYPTQGQRRRARRPLKDAGDWTAKGELKFLNDWKYKLGSEILTPYAVDSSVSIAELNCSMCWLTRQTISVSLRDSKYGFLLDKMKGRKPVFRTESQE